MKFSVTRTNLVKGLTSVNRVASTRTTLPILGNILLATDKGRLKMVSTDLELAIETHIGAKVETQGAITVPSRTFSEFISASTDETIEFELKDSMLHVVAAHVTADLKGLDAGEFPSVPESQATQSITCVGPTMKEAIAQVVFACANDDTRPILGGVALTVSKTTLTLAATDSYRLAEKQVTVDNPQQLAATAIVPARTLVELNRLITDDVASVSFVADKHQIVFQVGDSRLTSRLIDGVFPAYEGIIPKNLTTAATMNRNEWIAALKLASLFSRDSAFNVTFSVEETAVTLKALSAAIGTATSSVVASVTGPSVTIAFNAKFILDALQVMTADAVQLRVSSPENNQWLPGIVSGVTDQNYQYIIMPLRTE